MYSLIKNMYVQHRHNYIKHTCNTWKCENTKIVYYATNIDNNAMQTP